MLSPVATPPTVDFSVSLRYAPASYEATVGAEVHPPDLTETYFCSVFVVIP